MFTIEISGHGTNLSLIYLYMLYYYINYELVCFIYLLWFCCELTTKCLVINIRINYYVVRHEKNNVLFSYLNDQSVMEFIITILHHQNITFKIDFYNYYIGISRIL